MNWLAYSSSFSVLFYSALYKHAVFHDIPAFDQHPVDSLVPAAGVWIVRPVRLAVGSKDAKAGEAFSPGVYAILTFFEFNSSRKILAISGSNCEPALLLISSCACWASIFFRYARSCVIAS